MKRDSKCSFHVHWEKQEEKIPLNVYSDLRHNYKNLLISREGKHWKKLSRTLWSLLYRRFSEGFRRL